MCGIVGIYSHEPVAAELYESLIQLQHRGQDVAGMITCDERFYPKHGLGLVREIFTPPKYWPAKRERWHRSYTLSNGRRI